MAIVIDNNGVSFCQEFRELCKKYVKGASLPEESVSEDLEEAAKNYMRSQNPPIWGLYYGFKAGAQWMNKKLCSEIERRLDYIEFQCHRADTYKELKSLLAYIKSYV